MGLDDLQNDISPEEYFYMIHKSIQVIKQRTNNATIYLIPPTHVAGKNALRTQYCNELQRLTIKNQPKVINLNTVQLNQKSFDENVFESPTNNTLDIGENGFMHDICFSRLLYFLKTRAGVRQLNRFRGLEF